MNFRKHGKREEPEINLIPLIDLFLVIIIFLMVSTTYSKFSELQITLPTADAEKSVERPNQITIAVGSDGRYALDGYTLQGRSVATLAEAMRATASKLKGAGSGKDPVIVINADAQATHQAVVNVMEAARMADLSQITFATQNPAGTN